MSEMALAESVRNDGVFSADQISAFVKYFGCEYEELEPFLSAACIAD